MELRRALMLFAIVLALAAVASAVSQPPGRDDEETAEQPAPIPEDEGRSPARARPGPGGEGLDERTVRIAAGGRLDRERVDAGRPTAVLVVVRTPGRVEIPSLGLTTAATPLAPARFDLFEREPARHRVRFVPAGTEREAAMIAVLNVR